MTEPQRIKGLYARRRNAIRALQDMERLADEKRALIAEMEAELRGLVLFVTPFRYRYPVAEMRGKRLGRTVTAVLREATGPITTEEAVKRAAAAGGLAFATPKEAHAFGRGCGRRWSG